MDDKSLMVVILLMGLLCINNAVFKGLPKENRQMLGIIGAVTLIVSVYGLFVL